MTCRPATLEDVPRLLQLAQREHALSRFAGKPFDPLVATRNLEQAIAGMLTCVLISDSGRGFIAGVLQSSLFNRFFIAYELAWYAEDGSGMALLGAFAEWARNMLALDLVVSNYAGIKDDARFARVMQRAGFQALGASYIKSLN